MENRKIIISAVLLALFSTGCVKPTEELNSGQASNSNGDTVSYSEQPNRVTYEESSGSTVYSDPTTISTTSNSNVVYSDPTTATTTTSNSNVVYGDPTTATTTTSNSNVVYGDPTTATTTTSNSNVVYGDPISTTTSVYGDTTTTTVPNNSPTYGTYTGGSTVSSTDHYQPSVGTTSTTSTASGAYGAYSTPASSSGAIYSGIDDPYTSTGSDSYSSHTSTTPRHTSTPRHSSYSHNNSSYSSINNYHTNSSYSSSTNSSYSSHSGGGIELQVAALSSYYSAKEFKNGLSLPSKYSAYIKKGRINKVIIRGFSSRAEAKALAARQFPGAFIVHGSSSSSSYSSTPSYSGHSSSYSSHSSYTSSSAHSASGIGIQVGAFSSKDRARSVAKSKAGGKYTAIVKTAKVRGRTIYKAIILGFSSRAEAKIAIASGRFGDAFVVTIN